MGMLEIAHVFAREKAAGAAALIAFLMAGDPTPQESVDLALAAVEGGADMIEIGWPFSDPIADGPTIQASAQRALTSGVGPEKILSVAREVAQKSSVPVLLLSYLNPLLSLPSLVPVAEAGISGLVVPDLSLEESAPWREAAVALGMSLVPFASPTSGADRLSKIGRVAGPDHFVYCVAVKGVTGARAGLSDDAVSLLREARAHIQAPLALGFGIGSEASVRQARAWADGVIVGSALVQAAEEGGRTAVKRLVSHLKAAAKHA